VRRHRRCSIGGSPKDKNEIPPLGTLLHSSNGEIKGLIGLRGQLPSRFGNMGASALSREGGSCLSGLPSSGALLAGAS
jgi:hypothetical protein